MPNYEKALGYALEREKKLRAKIEAIESDWQLAEAENKKLREELERVQSVVGEEDYKSIEQALKGK